MSTRSPIVSVLGHVDHGKSSILDAIRETNIIATEAGAITQAIGASIVPLDAIKDKCGPLLERLDMKFTIPGLVFIDTPGHAAFTSLRKRGGAMADIAILAVDINEGFMPQTIEAIEILRSSKTPFVIAANKLDLVPGYELKSDFLVLDIEQQSPKTQEELSKRIYSLVGQLHEKFEMVGERFDKVDYTKQVAIVPCSAKKGIGISALLMVVAGLAQKFLEQKLDINVDGPAKGSVLEVQEQKGLGTTVDVILYDGTLNVNDTIVIGGLEEPIVTKVRSLLVPAGMSEMRDKKSKFNKVDKVTAATGVKIVAPGMEDVMAGMPMFEVGVDLEITKEQIRKAVESVLIEAGTRGIVIKADSIGSLEALLKMLQEENIPVARATVGSITKKDIAAAEAAFDRDQLHGVILGFNVSKVTVPKNIKLITGDIIYRIIDDYQAWQESQKSSLEASQLQGVARPCELEFLRGHTFRQCNPAVIGVAVTQGVMKVGTLLMRKDGTQVGIIKSIQADKDNVTSVESGKRVAISIPGATVGRQINEGDMLLSAISESDFRKLKALRKYLKDDEVKVMKEIALLMRQGNPVWGV
ncbi:translation initiation factor IF-2 [Nanoarchaeota archaeon]